MASIVYLDVDDEITSAAMRIRAAGEGRVALVLPDGSRLATSRINFRLLAREAMLHGRRLGIVAPDASTRALAASAGLPVFLTVGEYESSLDEAAPHDDAHDEREGERKGGHDETSSTIGSGLAASATAVGLGGPEATAKASRERTRPPDAPHAMIGSAPSRPATRPEPRRPSPRASDDGTVQQSPQSARSAATGTVSLPIARSRRPFRPPTGLALGVGALALALVVAGVAAWVLLPSATVAITPAVDTISLAFEVRADPDASAVDAKAGVIPAHRIDIPVTAGGQFPATDKRVVSAKATGTVRFDSINTVGPVSVPAGTRVSTLDAIVFATTRGVIVPRAQVNGTTIQHGVVDVGVRAIKDGPDGNVGAGEITQVPDSLSTLQVSVNNPEPAAGGKHDEFPRVSQKDVDAALEQLRTSLQSQFATAVASPPGLPQGATVFPETATLGEIVASVDTATLVGQEGETFALQATATGQVLAVVGQPLEQLVRDRLAGSVEADHQLIDGSMDVAVGAAVVRDGVISFPVRGVAQETRPIDIGRLEASILGKSRDQALAILGPFGDVQLTLWPEWVSAVPSLAQRVDIVLRTNEAPRPTAQPIPAPSATLAPSTVPSPAERSDAPSGQPLPSA